MTSDKIYIHLPSCPNLFFCLFNLNTYMFRLTAQFYFCRLVQCGRMWLFISNVSIEYKTITKLFWGKQHSYTNINAFLPPEFCTEKKKYLGKMINYGACHARELTFSSIWISFMAAQFWDRNLCLLLFKSFFAKS